MGVSKQEESTVYEDLSYPLRNLNKGPQDYPISVSADQTIPLAWLMVSGVDRPCWCQRDNGGTGRPGFSCTGSSVRSTLALDIWPGRADLMCTQRHSAQNSFFFPQFPLIWFGSPCLPVSLCISPRMKIPFNIFIGQFI